MLVIDEIAAERKRQVEVEGWSTAHDDEHGNGEMARASAAYAVAGASRAWSDEAIMLWPWSPLWWKPKSQRRDLIRAAALIVAEIERLDRAAKASP